MIPAQYLGLMPSVTPNDGGMGDLISGLRTERRADRIRGEDIARAGAKDDAAAARHALESDRSYDLQKEAIEGKNRFYDSKLGGEQNKRVNMLMDAYRKAAMASDASSMDMIRQELKRVAGYSIEDAPSATGEPIEAPAPVDAEAPAAIPVEKAPKVPRGKAPPKWLSGYMNDTLPPSQGSHIPSSDEANSVLASEGIGGEKLPGSGLDGQLPGSGLPGDALPRSNAMGSPRQGKPKGSGKFVVRDAQGNVINIYDGQATETEEQQRVRAAMAPMIAQATTPEEKAAGQQAMELASGLSAAMPVPDAIKLAMDQVKNNMGQFKKRAPEGAGGVGGPANEAGLSKGEIARREKANGDTLQWIKATEMSESYRDVPKAQALTNRGFSLLSGDRTGLGDIAAVKQLIKEFSGVAASDKEFSSIVDADGSLSRLERGMNQVTDGGKLPDQFVADLQRVMQVSQKELNRRRGEAGQKAYDSVSRSLTAYSPEEREQQADMARGYFTHQYKVGPKKEEAKPAGKPKAGAAPKATAPTGDDGARKQKALERARQLLGQ